MATSEADLVQLLRDGDESAFDEVVRTYGGRLLRVATRLLGNEADAQDAVQDAFISAYRSIDKFHGDARLSTWLHRITVNAALMRLRKQKRRGEEESLEPLLPKFRADGHFAESTTVPWWGVQERLEREETRQMVREAIDELPPSYRTVLLLRDIEELSTEEAANALSLTRTAVKVRLHRARQALRTLLDARLRDAQ